MSFDRSRFFSIKPTDVDAVRPWIEPFLVEFAQKTALVAPEDVLQQAKRADCQLWSYHDGKTLRCVIATTVNEGVKRKGCLVFICQGTNFLEIADGVIGELESWAKAIGCTHMEIVGRKGWAKVLPSYRARAVVFEKSFSETH